MTKQMSQKAIEIRNAKLAEIAAEFGPKCFDNWTPEMKGAINALAQMVADAK